MVNDSIISTVKLRKCDFSSEYLSKLSYAIFINSSAILSELKGLQT